MKKEERKKAQVTMFVILGIVMLIMFYFMIHAIQLVSQPSEEREMRRAAAAALSSDAVNYYMQSCLDVATTHAIDEIMIQGGVLYDYQNGQVIASEPGVTHIPISLDFGEGIMREVNVSYSIRKDANDCSIINYNVPAYPRQLTPLTELFSIYEEYFDCSWDRRRMRDLSGFFGLNNMTRLCVNGSINERPGDSEIISPCIGNFIIPHNNNPEPLTIETQLEKRILETLNECVDFQELEELEGTHVDILDGVPEIQVILNRNSVSVSATYPFIAALGDGETTVIKQEYRYASPHRITRLHNYVTSLLAADTKDITFNMSNTEHQKNQPLFDTRFPNVQRHYDARFQISIIPINCESSDCESYQYDRVLVVQDTSSYIGGRPLTLATAIQNRRPALDHIGPIDSDPPYHIFVNAGETLIIDPKGYDPDDRTIIYNYSGWKETYNYTCNNFVCSDPVPLIEPILTDSDLFHQTKRAVTYQTTSQDVGVHNVTITVIDSEGLYDYQSIRILVFDAPATETSTDTIYDHPDMPENVTSIEDPITISGVLDTPQQAFSFINYTWNITYRDTGEQIHFHSWTEHDSNPKIIRFPDTETYNDDLIQRIRQKLFNVSTNYTVQFIAGINYTEVTLGYVESTHELNLEIKQCIPFRNENEKIYPYNSILLTNPFMANHTCCGGELGDVNSYTLLGIDKACYSAIYYGEYNELVTRAQEKLKDDKFEHYPEYTQNNIIIDPQPVPLGTESNVFKLTLNRYCDGQRGNICAGQIIANLQTHDQCHNASLTEQCKGPPQVTSTNELSCTLYTTTNIASPLTFETTYNMPGATGACQITPACSYIGQNGYDSGGPNLCQRAFCSGGECTLTFPDDCACNQTCGAECYEGKTSDWEGNFCKFGFCDENSCEFSQIEEIKCADGAEYCYNEDDNFCHYNVNCTSAGVYEEEGEYCKRGELFQAEIPDPDEDDETIEVNVCLSGNQQQTDACNDEGECDYDITFFTCQVNRVPKCAEIAGAQCCLGTFCPPPNPISNVFYPDLEDVEFIYSTN